MAAEDVATAVGRVAVGAPLNGIVEVAGPEQFRLNEFVLQGLRAQNDLRTVVSDPVPRYFGVEVDESTLVPGNNTKRGETHFQTWLSQTGQPAIGAVSQTTVGASR